MFRYRYDINNSVLKEHKVSLDPGALAIRVGSSHDVTTISGIDYY